MVRHPTNYLSTCLGLLKWLLFHKSLPMTPNTKPTFYLRAICIVAPNHYLHYFTLKLTGNTTLSAKRQQKEQVRGRRRDSGVPARQNEWRRRRRRGKYEAVTPVCWHWLQWLRSSQPHCFVSRGCITVMSWMPHWPAGPMTHFPSPPPRLFWSHLITATRAAPSCAHGWRGSGRHINPP